LCKADNGAYHRVETSFIHWADKEPPTVEEQEMIYRKVLGEW
jgi:hypothetical protein